MLGESLAHATDSGLRSGHISHLNQEGDFNFSTFLNFKSSLRYGASYQYEDGVTALYLDGSRAHADAPAVSLQFPAFTITCWVKALEPAKRLSYVYSDWMAPLRFSIFMQWKVLFFWLKNELGQNLIQIYTG